MPAEWIRRISRIKNDESCNWKEYSRRKEEIRIEEMKIYSECESEGGEYEIRYLFENT